MKKITLSIVLLIIVVIGGVTGYFLTKPSIYKIAPATNNVAQDSDEYIIYFSSKNCQHCRRFEKDAIAFYEALSEDGQIDMYVIESSKPENKKYYALINNENAVENVDFYTNAEFVPENYNLDDFEIFGTPEALYIKDGKIEVIAVGISGTVGEKAYGGVSELFEQIAQDNNFEYDAKTNNEQ